MVAVKLIPQLFAWVGIVLVLLRGFPGRRAIVTATVISGFVLGVAGAIVLFRSIPGALPYGMIKSALGVSFLLLWGTSVISIFRSTGRGGTISGTGRFMNSTSCAGAGAFLTGIIAGAVSACRLLGAETSTLTIIFLVLVAGILTYFALSVESMLPVSLKISPSGLLTAVVALLLFSSASVLRLDLFAPLSMKMMKGVHDFVHQFMESILIPDHLFVKPVVWKYIGFLFGKEVGFWGGLVIWFTPAALVALAINLQRPPSVAHIRQGAQRRKQLAAAIAVRRSLLVAPFFSVMVFGAAAYQSSFPSVEYWDPKPLPVTANQAGEIIIPKNGEVNLADGKLHKYLFKQGGREARFFVLQPANGQLTVDLDACAICKPDGYGQAEGSVICYYCKTLIPLETVGKPGGCNPVPIQFTDKTDSVVVDSITLINSWSTTVQATARVKEGGP